MVKFKIFRVTPDDKRTLEYQLEVEDVRPGTSAADVARDYILTNVFHRVFDHGMSPLQDSDGVHLTKWVVLDDKDIWWVIPVSRFVKKPGPILVKG
jgi:hypothetical protein